MTALDKALIKAYRRPAPQSTASAEPVAVQRKPRAVSPLTAALDEISRVPAAVAPVGPAIAELLADAAHSAVHGTVEVATGTAHVAVGTVEQVGEVARAVVDPSAASDPNTSPQAAATASVVRAALPVVLAATVPAAAPIVAGALAAAQAAAPAVRAARAAATASAATEPDRTSSAEMFESPGLGSLLKKKTTAPTPATPASLAQQTVAAKLMAAAVPANSAHDAAATSETESPACGSELRQDAMSADEPAANNDAPAWHPMLQVDRVVWPSALSRMQGTASEALDQMVDGLRKIQTAGQKVIGMASCSEGEGVSTLMLAAAKRMSSQGLRVAIVDANMARPTLATAVGLLPQMGWENALSGEALLEDVVIDAEFDHVAILPTIHAPETMSASVVASHLETLSQNFDSVMVDLGALFAADGQWNEAAGAIGANTSGMVLVQNVRKTTPSRLADAQQHLEQSGVALMGMIQNFVVA